MALNIFAVLDQESAGALQDAARRAFARTPKVEFSGTLLEAIQKMYLLGPPDLLIVDPQLAGPGVESTLSTLRTQPGFGSFHVALVASGDRPVWEGEGPLRIVPSSRSAEAWRDLLSQTFPDEPAAPAGGAPAPPRPGQGHPENRKAPRRHLAAPCIVWAGAKKHSGKLKDISLSGARVFVEADLPLAAHATLSVAVPGSIPLKVIQFKALVVRWEPGGYGLSFWEMDQETRQFLKHYTGAQPPGSAPN